MDQSRSDSEEHFAAPEQCQLFEAGLAVATTRSGLRPGFVPRRTYFIGAIAWGDRGGTDVLPVRREFQSRRGKFCDQ
jgi:hypothetical protein